MTGKIGDIKTPVQILACEIKKLKNQLSASETITVATYADAVPLFAGSAMRFVGVVSDTVYNDGEKSLYVFIPGLGAGQILADFNYTTP